MSLRKALRYSEMSSYSYFYKPVPRVVEPDPAIVRTLWMPPWQTDLTYIWCGIKDRFNVLDIFSRE